MKMKSTKTHSIKAKLIWVCLSFALIPVLIVSLLYTIISKQALQTTSNKLSTELIKQTSISLDTFTSNTETTVSNFMITNLIKNNLLNLYYADNTLVKVKAISDIERQFLYLQTLDPTLKEISFISDDDTAIGDISFLNKDELLALDDKEVTGNFVWENTINSPVNSVLLSKKYKDLTSGRQYTLAVHVNLDHIIKNIDDMVLLDHSNFYLVDEKGQIIYTPNETMTEMSSYIWPSISPDVASGSIMTNKHLIAYSSLTNGWKVIVETPESSLTTQLNSALIIIILLILATALLAILVGLFFARSFSTPIVNLMHLMKRVEQGDLTVEIPEKGNDEIAQLCKSFNQMITNIRDLLKQTTEVISSTLVSTKMLHSSTDQSVEAFNQLTISIADIAQGTTVQALDAQKSGAHMADLSTSIQTVMTKTDTLLENNKGATEMIETATTTIDSLTTAMTSSLEVSDHIHTSMSELRVLNRSIEDIMQLVESISEQTNLLALNASIEAARVGEAGKGFAVVAHEVRNLADQSHTSTVDVKQTLSAIERKMTETSLLVNKSNEIFKHQEEVVKQTHALFFDIIDTLRHMNIDLGDVNTSINEMYALKDSMSTQIDSIVAVTQESAATTEEVSSLSEEQQDVMHKLAELSTSLTQSMETLNASIKTFKI